jgi:hypothetical protein
MKRIYAISGLAVDERLFSRLQVTDAEIIPVKWITPFKNEPLPDYAMRLSSQIDTSKPFYLLGVSFGGMCALEISKHLHPVKTILISSAKGPADLPWYFYILRAIPFHKVLGDRILTWMAKNNKWIFGIKKGEQAKLFYDMLDKAPKDYPRRAIECIVRWKNTESPSNLVHIHGTSDLVIPFKNVKDCIPVKKGTHFMVMNSAEEVSRIVNELL